MIWYLLRAYEQERLCSLEYERIGYDVLQNMREFAGDIIVLGDAGARAVLLPQWRAGGLR
jgi:hypothetical protein